MLFKEKIDNIDKRNSNIYINEIKNKKIHNEEIQQELFSAWKNHKDYNSRNKLIESNVRLATNRAIVYFKKTNNFPLSELIATPTKEHTANCTTELIILHLLIA